MVAAQSGVNRSVESNQIVAGSPAMPREKALRVQGVIFQLPELKLLVRDLEQRVVTLENQLTESVRRSARSKAGRSKKK
jgi:UDP-3-O-[3-hydroxymyristoyl] glucosamine N-acyltransferase